MKRIFRKNQIIITVLAVMIAVAGYLNYSGRLLEEEAAALVGALRQMGLDREQAAALVLQLWDRQEESP